MIVLSCLPFPLSIHILEFTRWYLTCRAEDESEVGGPGALDEGGTGQTWRTQRKLEKHTKSTRRRACEL